MKPRVQVKADLKPKGLGNSVLKELLVVIIFAFICTVLMVHLEAFESLYKYSRALGRYAFGEIAVFLPSFLAIGFVLYSYRRIEELEFEIAKRHEAENELRKSQERYKELSITDDLTQLYNSRYFYTKLKEEISRSVRYKHPLSLLLIDIDDFKKLNDNYGHLEGDKVLGMAGKAIQDCIRKTDSVYRYGGEEFTVILPETGHEGALNVAERIRKTVEAQEFFSSTNEALHITISIGACHFEPGEEMAAFVKRVDNAMYMAKRMGKNQVSSS